MTVATEATLEELEGKLRRQTLELDEARQALRRALMVLEGLSEQVTDYWRDRYKISELRAQASRALKGEDWI